MRFLQKTCVTALALSLSLGMIAGMVPAAVTAHAAGDHDTEIIPIGDQPQPATCFRYHTNSTGGITITDYLDTSPKVIIPATINGLKVTNIVPSAFHWSVDSLMIPRYVERFEEEGTEASSAAGEGTGTMKTITVSSLNNYYKAVDGVLFSKDGTVLYKIPDGTEGTYSLPSGTRVLSKNALVNCHALEGLWMNDELDTFEAEFIGCERLSSLSNDTARHFYTDGTCLYNAAKTTLLRTVPTAQGSIEVLPSAKALDSGAFRGCGSITSVSLPDGLQTIGSYAFSGCGKIAALTIPDSVTTLSNFALADMTALTSLQLSSGTATLPTGVISGDSSLQELVIPGSITVVEDGAFTDCSDLCSVEIPDSVIRMGEVLADGTIESQEATGIFTGSPKAVLYGSETGCAALYAARYQIPFARQRLRNLSTMSAHTVQVGTAVTLTGAASGGKSGYRYAFSYKKATGTRWTVIGTAYTTESASFTPGAATVYDVKVSVKDANGAVVDKLFTLTAEKLTNTSFVSNTDPGLGETVVITGSAEGGVGTCTYAFYFKKATSSGYTAIGTPFGSAATASFKPGVEAAYQVKVVVKDSSGKTAAKVISLQSHKLKNTSTLSAETAVVGTPLLINGSAEGGTAAYRYAFYYKKSTSAKWTQLTGTDSASFTPGAEAVYTIKVVVTDANGKNDVKLMSITASRPSALSNHSYLSKTNAAKGETVTVFGTAQGGTAPYTYAYYYRKSGSSSWTKLSDGYVSNLSVTFKVNYAVIYEVKVIVKDNKGKTDTKVMQVKVSAVDPYEGPIL